MTAQLAVVDTRPHLQVLEGGLSPKRGRPSKEDDARLELQARYAEMETVNAFMAHTLPAIRRLAREASGNDYRLVQAHVYMLERMARQWAPEAPEAA